MDQAEAEIDQIITNSLIEQHKEQEDSTQLNRCDNMATSNEVSNTDTSSAEDAANVEVFNTALHQYLRVNEEIKSLMLAVKERNDIKRKLGDTLSNYLKAKQIKQVNLNGSYKGKRLEVEVKTSNTGFNKTSVTEALLNELHEENELFDKIMQAISKTNVLKEVWKIKITEEKATRNAANGGKKGGKGRRLGTSMAEAAALIEDD